MAVYAHEFPFVVDAFAPALLLTHRGGDEWLPGVSSGGNLGYREHGDVERWHDQRGHDRHGRLQLNLLGHDWHVSDCRHKRLQHGLQWVHRGRAASLCLHG